MNQDFSFFEHGIDRVSRRLPGMPRDQVVLNRLFFFVFKELDELYNQRLAHHGLNSTTFLALVMLYSSEGARLNPCDLSDALVSSRTNVTRLTDELVGAGWVQRQASSEDRRRIELSLTGSGSALVETVLPVVWDLVRDQWSDFSQAEIVEFNRLLRKLLAGPQKAGKSP
jgi:MarR family transcriptional regulator, negative regulator of the multidrug operon emrRAB